MICPSVPTAASRPKHLVTEALDQIAASPITIELVEPKEEALWNRLIRKHHYLKEHRMVGESLRYVAKQNGQWIALLGWSSAAFHLRPRDAWIGRTEAQRKAGRHLLACNARFALLLPKGQSSNLASHLLSLNLQRLSEDWHQRYGHPILLVETYVDPERFAGTCYRAANWIEIGMTQGFGRSRLDFYQLHDKPKAIFLYPLHRKARHILSAPVMPPAWAPYRREAQSDQYPLNGRQTKSLLKSLETLKDPRRHKGWRHRRVASIVAIATAAIIAGNDTLLDIGEFSQSLNQKQLHSLRASRSRKTGKFIAPSESTIRRVLQRLDPTQLDLCINDWLGSHLQELDLSALAVDGKCKPSGEAIGGLKASTMCAMSPSAKIARRFALDTPHKTLLLCATW
jgi:hypothetical protein